MVESAKVSNSSKVRTNLSSQGNLILEFYCDRTFHKLIYFQKYHIDVNYTGPFLHILHVYSRFKKNNFT